MLLGSSSWCGLVVNFGDTQTEQSDTSWILQLIRKHEAEPLIRRLITHCASAHKLSRLGKWEAWGPRKKSQKEVVSEKRRGPGKQKVKILAAGKFLEVGEDPGDRRVVWRRMPGMPGDLGQWCQRLVPESSRWVGTDPTFCMTVLEQQWPPCREGKSGPREHSTVGREWVSVWNNQVG